MPYRRGKKISSISLIYSSNMPWQIALTPDLLNSCTLGVAGLAEVQLGAAVAAAGRGEAGLVQLWPDVLCEHPPSPRPSAAARLSPLLERTVFLDLAFPGHSWYPACRCRCIRIWKYPRFDSQFNNYWPLSVGSCSTVADFVSSGLELFYFPSL